MNIKNFIDLFRFSKTYEKSIKSINKNEPWGVFAHQALDNISLDLNKFLIEKSFNNDFITSHCQGAPSMPRITWVSITLPRTKVSYSPSYTICFGRAGIGIVHGIMLPANVNWPHLNPILRENNKKFININGTKKELHYNNRYINPEEIYADAFDMDQLKSHLTKSLLLLKSLNIN